MAFAVRNLSVLAYAQGFTLWHYRANATAAGRHAPAATLAEVSAPGFFNAATDMLAPGDMVLVSATDGGRVLFVAGSAAPVETVALAA
jgi:hypothetical protein